MDKDQLKESLVYMGVPIYRNDKIRKKDIVNLPFEDSGIQIKEIKKIEVDKHPEYYLCHLHIVLSNDDVSNIDSVFAKNKKNVEQNMTHYLQKNELQCVTKVDLAIKSRNANNLWMDVYIYFDLKPVLDSLSTDCFFYQLLERN